MKLEQRLSVPDCYNAFPAICYYVFFEQRARNESVQVILRTSFYFTSLKLMSEIKLHLVMSRSTLNIAGRINSIRSISRRELDRFI
jgi:hypothetical protein